MRTGNGWKLVGSQPFEKLKGTKKWSENITRYSNVFFFSKEILLCGWSLCSDESFFPFHIRSIIPDNACVFVEQWHGLNSLNIFTKNTYSTHTQFFLLRICCSSGYFHYSLPPSFPHSFVRINKIVHLHRKRFILCGLSFHAAIDPLSSHSND